MVEGTGQGGGRESALAPRNTAVSYRITMQGAHYTGRSQGLGTYCLRYSILSVGH